MGSLLKGVILFFIVGVALNFAGFGFLSATSSRMEADRQNFRTQLAAFQQLRRSGGGQQEQTRRGNRDSVRSLARLYIQKPCDKSVAARYQNAFVRFANMRAEYDLPGRVDATKSRDPELVIHEGVTLHIGEMMDGELTEWLVKQANRSQLSVSDLLPNSRIAKQYKQLEMIQKIGPDRSKSNKADMMAAIAGGQKPC
ncbi:MAG: hypothetical protein AAGJ09_09765 [Pseudomonadota bacterium]